MTNAYVDVSKDKTAWTELGNTSEHPYVWIYDQSTMKLVNEYVLYAPIPVRYVRFSMTLNTTGWQWNYYKTISAIDLFFQ